MAWIGLIWLGIGGSWRSYEYGNEISGFIRYGFFY
jgi:hypothetical protein